jgi:hypothetical protein
MACILLKDYISFQKSFQYEQHLRRRFQKALFHESDLHGEMQSEKAECGEDMWHGKVRSLAHT